MIDAERINHLLRTLKVNKLTLAKSIGGKSDARIRHVLTGRSRISENLARELTEVIKGLNYDWIKDGIGEPPTQLSLEAGNAPSRHPSEAEDIGFIDGDGEEVVTKNGNVHQIINDDWMTLQVPIVEPYAYAGYLSGWNDTEYIETLPMMPILVEKVHKGIYRGFRVRGDSMTDGKSRHQVLDGEIVVGRQVSHNLWKSKLHINTRPVWVIVHEEGILVKSIIYHNVEGREITVRSINPDRETYPDRILSLNDVYELYNVVKKITEF